MRKATKIATGILGGLILMAIILWMLIQYPPVQNKLVKLATDRASAITGTTIEIGSVDLSLFNRFYLNKILIRDQKKDTLLYAGSLKLKITDWFFLKDEVSINYIGLENALIQTNRRDSIWNYQFLLNNLSSGNKTPKANAPKSPRLDLIKLELDKVRYYSKDMWRGEDQSARIDHLALNAKEIDLNQKKITIDRAEVEKPDFRIRQYKGFRPDSLRPKTPIRTKGKLYWNPEQWTITVNNIELKNGLFASDLNNGKAPLPYFDGAHLLFKEINGTIKGLKFMDDTLKGDLVLRAKERSGLQITSLKAKMKMDPDRMGFTDLKINTPNSSIGDQFTMEYRYFNDDMAAFISNVNMRGNIQDSWLALKDISYFAPALKNSDLKVRISGRVTGTVQKLAAEKISLEYRQKTNVSGDLFINGLPDVGQTTYQLDNARIQTDADELLSLVPGLRKNLKINLKNAGTILYTGKISADHDRFNAKGLLSAAIGKIDSKIILNNIYEKNVELDFDGELIKLNAGRLLSVDGLDEINGHVNIKGNANRVLSFDANINSLNFNNYSFHKISTKGNFNKGLFKADLDIDDTNLIATLSANIDLNGKDPKTLVQARVQASDLKAIKITKLPLEFTGSALFDFTGDDPDNINGSVSFNNITFFKDGQPYVFDNLYFSSINTGDIRNITLTGKDIDAKLSGKFEFAEMAATFNQYFSSYYPLYFEKIPPPKKDQLIEFHLNFKNTSGLFKILNDGLNGFSYSRIDGKIDTRNRSFYLDAEIPKLSFNKLSAYDFTILARGDKDSLRMISKTSSIIFNDSLFFPNNEISIRSSKDVSSFDINTFSEQSQYGAKLSGTVVNLKDGIKLHFNPSSLVFNEKTWMIDQDGEVVISKSFFDAKNFRISNGEQSIGLISLPAEAMRPQTIVMNLTKVNLGEILPFVLKEPRIQGITTGDLTIEDPFNKAKLYLNAQTEKTRFEDDSIGLTSVNAFWDNEQKRAGFNFDSENPNYQLDLTGKLDLHDSLNKKIETNINLKNVNLSILKPYLGIVFSDISGYGNGVLQIIGDVNNPTLVGKVKITDAKVTIGYTKCTYVLSDPTIEFLSDRINFGEIKLKDIFGNAATVKGELEHQFFKKFRYNISASSKKLQVLNTLRSDNDLFYGKAIGRFNFSMTGPEEQMRMNINGAPVDSSVVNILTSTSSKQKADVDYIVWKKYGTEISKKKSESNENLIIDLDLSATPLLKMNVILDELTGDIISGQGNGNLKIHTGTKENLSMNGRYNIENGSYNFNFQDIFKKPFKLLGGGSSYISWNGDPYEAEININALYLAEKVRMSTLFTEPGNGAISGVSADVLREISDVEVRCNLTGTLNKPNPAFQIVIPQNSTVRNNSTIDSKIKTINRDPLEVSKQSTYLIVFKSFAPQAAVVASDLNSELINTTISGVINGILSNSIQNLFSKVLGSSVDVNFNYSRTMTSMGVQGTGNGSQNNFRENVSLQFIKTLLNDKLIITFGSDFNFAAAGGNALATTQSFLFLPDVNVEYKITPDGKFRTSFFYRSSFDLLSTSGKRDRTGGNISFRTEFDTMFGKRKKNTVKQEQ